jgi:hypothetical protein
MRLPTPRILLKLTNGHFARDGLELVLGQQSGLHQIMSGGVRPMVDDLLCFAQRYAWKSGQIGSGRVIQVDTVPSGRVFAV